jgi:hypothetical protein
MTTNQRARGAEGTVVMLSREALTRREFLAGAAAIGAAWMLPGEVAAAADGK